MARKTRSCERLPEKTSHSDWSQIYFTPMRNGVHGLLHAEQISKRTPPLVWVIAALQQLLFSCSRITPPPLGERGVVLQPGLRPRRGVSSDSLLHTQGQATPPQIGSLPLTRFTLDSHKECFPALHGAQGSLSTLTIFTSLKF